MPTIRSRSDYDFCLLEILRAARGRMSQGQVYREFDRRYISSVSADDRRGANRDGGGPPRWQRSLDDAARRLIAARAVYAPDPESWEIV